MSEKPAYGVAVADLERSVAFYRDKVGLTVDVDTSHPDSALLTTFQGMGLLLAGPDAPEWSEMLDEQHTILKRGEKIFMGDPEFDERLERFRRDGVDFELIERPWGDRMIEIECPDGYGVSLWMIRERTREEILEQCRMARDGIREAIEGLTAEELRWRPAEDEWSVVEIVHHVADSNLTVLHAARVAIAEPGRRYQSNPYDQNDYNAALRYRDRDVEPSLRLYETSFDVLFSLIDVVPDAWERSIVSDSERETTIETFMLMQATHSLEHLEQIRETRRALGR